MAKLTVYVGHLTPSIVRFNLLHPYYSVLNLLQLVCANTESWSQAFLARLTGLSRVDVKEACAAQQEGLDALLADLDGRRRANDSGIYNTRFLYFLCRLMRPTIVVETGVASGVSSYVILRALADNGRGTLVSIDLPEGKDKQVGTTFSGRGLTVTDLLPGEALGWLVPDRLRTRWRLVTGRSWDVLPGVLADLGRVDLFVHDSEHTYENMTFEFRTAWKFLRSRGVLLSDDIAWNSAFLDFAKVHRRMPVILGGRLGGIVR